VVLVPAPVRAHSADQADCYYPADEPPSDCDPHRVQVELGDDAPGVYSPAVLCYLLP
jgi:hypothetical protein